jgi:serine/threonine-protein kinase HipA
MSNVEVHIELDGLTQRVGLLRQNRGRRGETISFEYDDAWLKNSNCFSLEPALSLTPGTFHPSQDRAIFGSVGDSAPDTWGRQLMQRAERRCAEAEKRAVRTLSELDYLLGVSDETRLGALRFRRVGDEVFQTPLGEGVPALIKLGQLMESSQRILQNEETDDDLQLIFAPGSSLGGARPKASVIDQHNQLSIAKFPKDNDPYSIEAWEEVAMRLAGAAGITVPPHRLVEASGKVVMLSRRFDRINGVRIPFLSAMSMTDSREGVRGSYPEIVDSLVEHGARAKEDSHSLYRRVVFNVLISNVDDHLRNHGFLWLGRNGWSLSPAYDLNPTPTDLKARILTTNIDLEEGTCSLDLLESSSEYFDLKLKAARAVIKEVALATSQWRIVAKKVGLQRSEIDRMSSAFEHKDLDRALAL